MNAKARAAVAKIETNVVTMLDLSANVLTALTGFNGASTSTPDAPPPPLPQPWGLLRHLNLASRQVQIAAEPLPQGGVRQLLYGVDRLEHRPLVPRQLHPLGALRLGRLGRHKGGQRAEKA